MVTQALNIILIVNTLVAFIILSSAYLLMLTLHGFGVVRIKLTLEHV